MRFSNAVLVAIVASAIAGVAVANPPTVAITTTSGNDYHNAVDYVELDFTLSASSTDFAVGDITVSGCTIGTFSGSGTDYTARVTPSGSGVCTVDVAASTFTDTATSTNNDAATQLALYHGIPSVTIITTDDNSGTHDGSSAVAIQVTFGSPVSADGGNDFLEADVTISGGTISSFTEATGANADRVWTFDATPSGTGNMQIYVASSVAQSTDSAMWNTASNVVTFVYTTQWGQVSLKNIASHASRGAVTADASVSGTTSTVTLQNHKWKNLPGDDTTTGVKVCLERLKDDTVSAAALDGTMTVELTVSTGSLTDVIVNADEDGDSGTGTATNGFEQLYSSALSTGGTFQLKWGDAEVGEKCFYVGRTAWDGAGDEACTAAAENFSFTIEAVDVEEDAACTSGEDDDTSCGDNNRYFANGLATITIARSLDVMPNVRVLPVETVTPLFDSSDAPPSYNDPMYAQDEPKRLVVFYRECVGEYASATDVAATFFDSNGDVSLNLADTDVVGDVSGSPGIISGSNIQWYDVTDNYADTDTTWTEMQDLTGESAVTTVDWSGRECGTSSYKYYVAHFHAGDGDATLDAAEQAALSLGGTGGLTPSCAASAYTAADPNVLFVVRNDPTRDDTIFDTGAATEPMDLRTWVGTPSLSGSDFTVDIAQRLHLSGENAKKGLHIVGLGDGYDLTGSGYRFTSANNADICSSLPDSFEADLGSISTVDDLFDALYDGTAVYQSSATDLSLYGDTTSLTMSNNPFYPWNGGDNPVVSDEWTAIAASQGAGELCYLSGEDITDKYCAKHSIAGTLSELRACKNDDGSDVLTVDNVGGVTTYTLKVFFQVISYRGTDPDDRQWETVQLVTKEFSFSFDTSIVSSVWTDSADIDVTAHLLNVATEVCDSSECSYPAYTGIASEFPCDCGGSCPSTAAFRRLKYQVLVDIPRTGGRETGGDVGLRDTIHSALIRADQTDGKDTCYGLATSAAESSVVFVSNHDSVTSVNRFIITARTECISQYSTTDGDNADDAFATCSNADYLDNFDFKIVLSQLRTSGQSWAYSLARRLGDSAYIDAGIVPLSIRFHYQNPVSTPSIGTGDTAVYTAVTTKLFKDPDYQNEGTWFQDSTSADLTSAGTGGGAVTFLETDRLIITQELSHAATKDVLILHIEDVHVCTLDPDSTWFNCLHPKSTTPASDTGYGAFVTQSACPTGVWAELQYSCDASLWDQYIVTIGSPTSTQINPVASSWDFVRNFAPTAPWADETGAETAYLCRYAIKSDAQKASTESSDFFCSDYGTSDSYCGASSTVFYTNRQPGMADRQWDKLSGFGAAASGTPIQGSDAVEIPLAALPTGENLVVTVRSRAWDCGDGSEHDGGGRRLLAAPEGAVVQASYFRGARALSEFSSEEGSSAVSGGSSIFSIGSSSGPGGSQGSNHFFTTTGGIIIIVVLSIACVCCLFLFCAKRRSDDDDDDEGETQSLTGGAKAGKMPTRGGRSGAGSGSGGRSTSGRSAGSGSRRSARRSGGQS